MKIVYKDKIVNYDNNLFDNRFIFKYFDNLVDSYIEIYDLWILLKDKENTELLNNLWDKYAMYSNVYSPKDELAIFNDLFEYALVNNKKIHIVWVTLKKEILILEKYYEKLWYMRDDINCFEPKFSDALVTVSVNIENLIWKWSDYKRMRKDIFYIPPIRESWENKAMFKWINRGVIAWINIDNFSDDINLFLWNCVREEKILPLTLSKLLKYNLADIWFTWIEKDLIINY